MFFAALFFGDMLLVMALSRGHNVQPEPPGQITRKTAPGPLAAFGYVTLAPNCARQRPRE